MRKLIQLTVCNDKLFGLADDGAVWVRDYDYNRRNWYWRQLESLP